MYRIKTKEEFIEEFGHGWRGEVIYGWVEGMNNLFGRCLDSWHLQCLDSEGSTSVDGWRIHKRMIIEESTTEF